MEPPNLSGDATGVEVLPFDYSVENHLQAVDIITRLCGEEDAGVDDNEIARLSSSIKFLRYCLDQFLNYLVGIGFITCLSFTCCGCVN